MSKNKNKKVEEKVDQNTSAPQAEEKNTESQPQEQTRNEDEASKEQPSAEGKEDNGSELSDKHIEELEEKCKSLNDSYLRLMAEFDNYRKRTVKEKADIIKNASERVIIDFLPVVDNFERALKSMETAEDVAAVRQGVELIYEQVMSMLKNNGVTPIPTENLPFDTEYHEAITTIPAPTPDLKDKIIDCTTRGYVMNEKVIRHAKVVVGA